MTTETTTAAESVETSVEPAQMPQAQPSHPESSYEHEISMFLKSVEQEGLEKSLARHGFGLFHSLPVGKVALFREQLGMACRDTTDHYNLGVAWAEAGNMDAALAAWKRAAEGEPRVAEAVFNLAVACEKQGDAATARKYYNQYLQNLEDSEEAQQVKDHLATLG